MSGGDGYYSGLYSINIYPLCQEETNTIADYTLLIFILYVRRRQIL